MDTLPNILGKRPISGRRREGMHAQMTPRFDSMIVHIDEPMLFHVMSR